MSKEKLASILDCETKFIPKLFNYSGDEDEKREIETEFLEFIKQRSENGLYYFSSLLNQYALARPKVNDLTASLIPRLLRNSEEDTEEFMTFRFNVLCN